MLFASPRTGDERAETAQACVRNLGIKIPALLDGIDNRTERAYTGWPDRIYLIDTAGRIQLKTAPGPYGFSPKDLEQSLRELKKEPRRRNCIRWPR